MSHETPEYIMRFARAIAPDHPELLLSTSTEESLLTDAANTIAELRNHGKNLEAENQRLRESLELGWYQMGFILHKHGEDWGVGDREGTAKVYEKMNAVLEDWNNG